jgi:hypothetical protein
MPPSGSNATLRAAALSTRRAHESQVKIPTFRMRYLNAHSSKHEIVLSIEGDGGMSTFLAILSETGHPPRCEEGLPIFTLEKLVPGGIAEVSP